MRGLTFFSEKKCQPCEGGVEPLTKDQSSQTISQFPGWSLSDDGTKIYVQYIMQNFLAAVELIQSIATVAESEDHHPDIHLTGYRNLLVELTTHAIGGLSENDFIVASKIEQLPKKLKQ